MRKSRGVNRKRLIPLAAMVAVLAVLAFVQGSLGFRTAYVIKTVSDADMVLMEGTPVVIRDETPRKNAFEKYSTGDKILLVTDAVAESWPGRAAMHWCVKLDGGDYTAIPQDIRTALKELGYTIVGEILLNDEKAAPILAEYRPEIEFIEKRCGKEIAIIDDITMDIIKTQAAMQLDNKDYRFGEMMTAFAESISGGEAV
ncbi:MAG: hypothetical protein IJ410_04060 [Oscillospiraceae bacterium]|nr:hypothetical protein [Oscillospiraceae bacterium]